MTLPKKWIILHFKHTLKLITVHRHLFKCAAFLKTSTNFIFLQLSTKKNLRLSLKKILKTCHFQNQTTSKKTTWMYSTWMYIVFEKLISNCKNDLLFKLWKTWLSDDIKMSYVFVCYWKLICDAFCDLVQFVQFKKLKKHRCRGVIFITKSNTPPWVFLHFLNGTNGTKSRKASHIILILKNNNNNNKKKQQKNI